MCALCLPVVCAWQLEKFYISATYYYSENRETGQDYALLQGKQMDVLEYLQITTAVAKTSIILSYILNVISSRDKVWIKA